MLSDQIKSNIDVLLVSETKIDYSFPNGNFLIDGFRTLNLCNQVLPKSSFKSGSDQLSLKEYLL